MTFSTIHVSNSVLRRSFTDKIPVSPMKLQRILYFVANEYVKRSGNNLFDENFNVWQYGPVLRSVYDKFNTFGSNSITKYGKNARGKAYCVDESKEALLKDVLDTVWKKTFNVSAVTLSRVAFLNRSACKEAYMLGFKDVHSENMVKDFSYYPVLGFSTPVKE